MFVLHDYECRFSWDLCESYWTWRQMGQRWFGTDCPVSPEKSTTMYGCESRHCARLLKGIEGSRNARFHILTRDFSRCQKRDVITKQNNRFFSGQHRWHIDHDRIERSHSRYPFPHTVKAHQIFKRGSGSEDRTRAYCSLRQLGGGRSWTVTKNHQNDFLGHFEKLPFLGTVQWTPRPPPSWLNQIWRKKNYFFSVWSRRVITTRLVQSPSVCVYVCVNFAGGGVTQHGEI